MYPYIAFLAFFQAPQAGVPLIESCFEPTHVIATVGSSDAVEVRSSMAGEEQTCYRITAVIDGKPVDGYVLDGALKAVAEFEKRRAVPLAPPQPVASQPAVAAKVAPSSSPVAVEQEHQLPVLGGISGRNIKGKPVSLSGMSGKVILVCFWAPRNTASLREASLVTRLSGQYHQLGVNAMTVSLSGDRELMGEALEAITVPTLVSGGDIAARLGITFEALPRTYILNEKHEILASGLRGKELENRVRSLAAAQ